MASPPRAGFTASPLRHSPFRMNRSQTEPCSIVHVLLGSKPAAAALISEPSSLPPLMRTDSTGYELMWNLGLD